MLQPLLLSTIALDSQKRPLPEVLVRKSWVRLLRHRAMADAEDYWGLYLTCLEFTFGISTVHPAFVRGCRLLYLTGGDGRY